MLTARWGDISTDEDADENPKPSAAPRAQHASYSAALRPARQPEAAAPALPATVSTNANKGVPATTAVQPRPSELRQRPAAAASSASAQDATVAPKVERPAPSASAAAAAGPHRRRSSDERADRRSSGDATLSEPTGSFPQPSADGAQGHGKGKPASAKGKLPSADGSKPYASEVKQPKHRALPPEERPARKGADRAAEIATKVADAQSKWIYLGYGAALGGLLNMCAWLLWSYMSR